VWVGLLAATIYTYAFYVFGAAFSQLLLVHVAVFAGAGVALVLALASLDVHAVLCGVLALAACAAGPNDAASTGATHLAGVWPGLWHGIISPITFVISLFDHDVGMYEVHNVGGWYDFGFLLGVMLVFSGAPAPAAA
jgi:hypothetical protein